MIGRPGRVGPALAVAAALLVAAPGAAQQPVGQPVGWDGSNPFGCVVQQAGFNAEVPHPEADPYCVEFDKTHQNVDQLGVADFLSKEPARVAAASPKCFYFQIDHWRGSVVQDNAATKTYEWTGHYFFDKATGNGGAWVTDFNVNGRTADPSEFPGIPQDWARYLGPGTGGVITRDAIPADPTCMARAAQGPGVYSAAAARASGTAPASACARPTGHVTASALGPVALGDAEARVRALLGAPHAVRRGFLRYCQAGAGKYLVGLRGGPRRRVVMILTTNRAYRLAGVARGSGAPAFHRAFPRARALLREGATRVWTCAPGSDVVFGLRAGRVRYLAVYDRSRAPGRAALAGLLRRSQ